MKEKTADEMFEELGYKKKNLDIIFSRFWEEWENEDLAKTFSFNTEYETIDITDENRYGITMQELQAINKKVEELRMDKVKNWVELSKIKPNSKYKIVVDDDMNNGWVVPIIETKETIKNYFKHHLYLSTHTFYWSSREYYTKKLQEFGFNIKLIG